MPSNKIRIRVAEKRKKEATKRCADSARYNFAHSPARRKFNAQIAKEHAIGVDPIFLHSTARSFAPSREAWLKQSRKWDESHAA